MQAGSKLRRDVERNREAIVTAAVGVLAGAPHATMNEIARASSVGRSTLYRHFPDRATLIEAIRQRVLLEALGVVRNHLEGADTRDPVPMLTDITEQIAELGERYRFLADTEMENRHRDNRGDGGGLLDYLADCQRAGTVRSDLDADWLLTMLSHTFLAAIEHRLTNTEAPRSALAATLRSLLGPPA